jgi:hypothetical protein
MWGMTYKVPLVNCTVGSAFVCSLRDKRNAGCIDSLMFIFNIILDLDAEIAQSVY